MAPSITLWQAVEIWLAGQEIDRNAVLWGLDVTWWSRISKGGQFLAAGTAVIDIVGADRVRDTARLLLTLWKRDLPRAFEQSASARRLGFIVQIGAGIAAGVLLTTITPRLGGLSGFALSTLVAVIAAILLSGLGWLIAKGLSSRAPARVIRVVTLVVFAVSFSLDLLTS